MESPKRKFQKQADYQRHKLLRKIKRRRKAQAEAQQEVAEKQLNKKLKMPKYDTGKTREAYVKDKGSRITSIKLSRKTLK